MHLRGTRRLALMPPLLVVVRRLGLLPRLPANQPRRLPLPSRVVAVVYTCSICRSHLYMCFAAVGRGNICGFAYVHERASVDPYGIVKLEFQVVVRRRPQGSEDKWTNTCHVSSTVDYIHTNEPRHYPPLSLFCAYFVPVRSFERRKTHAAAS